MDLSPLTRGGNISGQLVYQLYIRWYECKKPNFGRIPPAEWRTYSISIEAVREFKVVTNQYDVGYGRSGEVSVSAVTKSNECFSGSMFATIELIGFLVLMTLEETDVKMILTTQYGFTLEADLLSKTNYTFL
jgi:hypothetical protein